jgi:hypothetical protein
MEGLPGLVGKPHLGLLRHELSSYGEQLQNDQQSRAQSLTASAGNAVVQKQKKLLPLSFCHMCHFVPTGLPCITEALQDGLVIHDGMLLGDLHTWSYAGGIAHPDLVMLSM